MQKNNNKPYSKWPPINCQNDRQMVQELIRRPLRAKISIERNSWIEITEAKLDWKISKKRGNFEENRKLLREDIASMLIEKAPNWGGFGRFNGLHLN